MARNVWEIMERSVIFDLRKPRYWLLNSTLSSYIKLPDGEIMAGISLPGRSLCADLLINSAEKTWVGVTVDVHDDNLDAVERLAAEIMGPRVRIKKCAGMHDSKYGELPDSNWLEVVWCDIFPDKWVHVLTNHVLWYMARRKNGSIGLSAVAIENIEYMVKESGENIALPNEIFLNARCGDEVETRSDPY